MDYGLPGKPGYSYNRPFDYFNFEAALSSANGVENLTSNGMLLGDHFALGRQRARHRRRLRRLRVPGAADLPRVDHLGLAGHQPAVVGGRAPGDAGRRVGRRRLRRGQLDPARRRQHRVPLRHGAARRVEPAADRRRAAVAGRRRRASSRWARSPTGRPGATTSRASSRRSPGASPARTRSASATSGRTAARRSRRRSTSGRRWGSSASTTRCSGGRTSAPSSGAIRTATRLTPRGSSRRPAASGRQTRTPCRSSALRASRSSALSRVTSVCARGGDRQVDELLVVGVGAVQPGRGAGRRRASRPCGAWRVHAAATAVGVHRPALAEALGGDEIELGLHLGSEYPLPIRAASAAVQPCADGIAKDHPVEQGLAVDDDQLGRHGRRIAGARGADAGWGACDECAVRL